MHVLWHINILSYWYMWWTNKGLYDLNDLYITSKETMISNSLAKPQDENYFISYFSTSPCI